MHLWPTNVRAAAAKCERPAGLRRSRPGRGTVRYDIARALDDQLSRPWHPSWPPKARLFGQHGFRSEYPANHQLFGLRIIERDVVSVSIQISQRGLQPANSHSRRPWRTTCAPLLRRPRQMRSRLHRLPSTRIGSPQFAIRSGQQMRGSLRRPETTCCASLRKPDSLACP